MAGMDDESVERTGDSTAGAEPSSTGDRHIDQILAALGRLDDLPVLDHADVYLDVHDRLSGELNPQQKLREAGAHGSS
ncbi:hypothetical protein RCH21_002243 [Arthrobacter sp. PL16]|nr:hypothetical protein [Arthrobacter sp. PL16]